MATTSPGLFPSNGQRQLSPKEMMQRAKAVSCTLPESSRPSCSGQIFVGIFFDGTGNNMKIDYDDLPPEGRKHSNVVKLFQTYPDKPSDGLFAYYIPGVGTPFPEIGDNNDYWGPNRGSVAAEFGEDRIIWGFTRLLNAPHQYVFKDVPLIPDPQARGISNTLAGSSNPGMARRLALNTWQTKLKAALEGKKPRVEQINLSVYGFSRGAAEARAFVNWLFEVCKEEGGGWTFAGIPLRLQFLGIFDTVASVGLANLFDTGTLAGHQSWADNSLEIHRGVEQCAHFVAGHEVRACFPLDSVRVKTEYPSNAMEIMYPGSHSDVGGGYAPSALGISPSQDSFVCIIPGVNMYHEARKAGVPLKSWHQLPTGIQKSLTPSSQVIEDFNNYIRAAAIGVGPVEDMHRRHMGLYFSQRFKSRKNYFEVAPFKAAPAVDQECLRKTQSCLMERFAKLGQGDPMSPDFDPPRAAGLFRNKLKAEGKKESVADKFLCDVAERIDVKSLKPEVETFLTRYIHDSMAGFIGFGMNEYSTNKIGIVKFRTVFKGND